MILGFTGTSGGMSVKQLSRVETIVLLQRPEIVVHGGCVGADTEFHALCLDRLPQPRIYVRPSNLKSKQGNWPGATHVYPERPPLDRNTDIVEDATHLIAAPKEMFEVMRSGTWSTVRRARKAGIPYVIAWPDGTHTYHGQWSEQT